MGRVGASSGHNSGDNIYAHQSRIKGKKIARDLFDLTQDMIPRLSFGEVARCSLSQDRRVKSFAFVDEYFDTPERDFWRDGASYRLRRRWSQYHHYVRHRLFPWSSLFPPSRVEIQAKTGYQSLGDHQMSVSETRLEFRSASPPFNEGFPLLPPRTSVKEFRRIAQSGAYQGHTIYPYASLLAGVKSFGEQEAVDIVLEPVLSLLSHRHRYHLKCRHPLGTGPNPEQIFIITVDEIRCLEGCCEREEMVEVEVERERNTSTMIDALMSYEDSPLLARMAVAGHALEYVRGVREAYYDDHRRLRRQIHSWLSKNELQVLAPAPKYHRFLCVDQSTVVAAPSLNH